MLTKFYVFFCKKICSDLQKASDEFGLQKLPLELIHTLQNFLSLEDLTALRGVSSYFNEIDERSLWKKKVQFLKERVDDIFVEPYLTTKRLVKLDNLTSLLFSAYERNQRPILVLVSELILNFFTSQTKLFNLQEVADFTINKFLTSKLLNPIYVYILCCESPLNQRPSHESIKKVLLWLPQMEELSTEDRVNFWKKIAFVNQIPVDTLSRDCVSTMLKFAAEAKNLVLVEFLYSFSGKNRPSVSSVDQALEVAIHNQCWPIVEYLCSNSKKLNRPSVQPIKQLLIENKIPLESGSSLIKYLCTQGEVMDREIIINAIKSAAQKGRLEIVKYFRTWLNQHSTDNLIFDDLQKQSAAYGIPSTIANWIRNDKAAIHLNHYLQPHVTPLTNVILLLEHYTKLSISNRLFTGAWGRQHIRSVETLITLIKNEQMTIKDQLIAQFSLIKSLANFNQTGSLAVHMQFIEEKLDWDSSNTYRLTG